MAIPSQDLMMTTKRCTHCEIEQPREAFYVRTQPTGRQYLASWCKACYRAKTRIWNATFRDDAARARWAVTAKARNLRIKDAVFGAYGGYRCACCGETERAFLTIDHIENDGATWRRETFGSRFATGWQTYRWLMKHAYPSGYQVLCMNCNFGKRMNHGVCPHQVRCNDYPLEGVEPSGSKRSTPASLKLVG
jgi:hypothetical protein